MVEMTLKNRPCAVLAEDEPAILMALDEVLTDRGFTTIPCTDGLSALEAIRAKRPVLAVFDVNMPGLTGTDVALRLRMVDVMDELRILMITGRDDLRTRRMILSSGADAFVIKPFSLKSFLEAVDRLVEGPSRSWLNRGDWYRIVPEGGLNPGASPPVSEDTDLGSVHGWLVSELARSLDERSLHQPYHTIQVAHLAQMIARSLGLDAMCSSVVRTAGVAHDAGMILIPDVILNRRGPLDEAEMARVRRHPATGAKMLAGFPELGSAAQAVLHHHERWDGGGYPEGLSGEGIPIEARILTVADAFSAMTTRRGYAEPLSLEEASRELDAEAGTQFDPVCVEAFHSAAGV